MGVKESLIRACWSGIWRWRSLLEISDKRGHKNKRQLFKGSVLTHVHPSVLPHLLAALYPAPSRMTQNAMKIDYSFWKISGGNGERR